MPLDAKAHETIRKYAIKNALEYGKARDDAVLSKVISKMPDLKKDMALLRKSIHDVVSDVNSLAGEKLRQEAEKYSKEFEEEYKEKVSRTSGPSLAIEGAKVGSFKTRFSPEPSGYMHIGHAKAAFLELELSVAYKGKIALYFDDTNPEKEKQEYVEAFKKDLEWLGIKFSEEYYASDHIDEMYGYARKLISAGGAYVCDCKPEQLKASRESGIACKHKGQTKEKNLKAWEEMLGKATDSDTVLLLNGDLKSQNTTMRDPTLFRAKEARHYRQGDRYTVWPTYSFNTPIMDSVMGITDAIRSKEYEMRDELYYRILDLLELRKPRMHSISRLEISGNITSKRKLNELISEGLIEGYDDPRLVTIAGMRHRGITPQAIREFVIRFGLSKAESVSDMDTLLSFNRKIIERNSKRLFCIEDPILMKVSNIPSSALKLETTPHPTDGKGNRKYGTNGKFLISRSDADKLKEGERIKLKGAFDVRVTKNRNGVDADYESDSKAEKKIVWVQEDGSVDCKIMYVGNLLNGDEFNRDSLRISDAKIEGYSSSLKRGDIVQLEAKGFFKFDGGKDSLLISL
ncbi:MAG: glutamate--tRNA ligase [Candidatus Micrarchaeota archaeon]|nr:glutamate--tRNA ligase [Candidatus Micrarchaeota archaeon]